jgi:hypothetical protein
MFLVLLEAEEEEDMAFLLEATALEQLEAMAQRVGWAHKVGEGIQWEVWVQKGVSQQVGWVHKVEGIQLEVWVQREVSQLVVWAHKVVGIQWGV